jgi:hypothetical protein
VHSPNSPRSSLESGTKLVGRDEGSWGFVLYPEAAEGGGSFRSAAARTSPGRRWLDPPIDTRDDAARRARGKVRRYCAANRLNRLGTLTYAGEGNFDPGELRLDVARFFKRLRAEIGREFPYLWVPEWHPGGHGLHVHFAVGQFVYVGVIREAWGLGHVHIKVLGDLPVGSGTLGEARLAARYLSKYLAKDLDAGGQPSGLHRYEVAQGFQPRSIGLDGQSADEVLGWAESVMDAPPVLVWRSRDVAAWAGPPAVWATWA